MGRRVRWPCSEPGGGLGPAVQHAVGLLLLFGAAVLLLGMLIAEDAHAESRFGDPVSAPSVQETAESARGVTRQVEEAADETVSGRPARPVPPAVRKVRQEADSLVREVKRVIRPVRPAEPVLPVEEVVDTVEPVAPWPETLRPAVREIIEPANDAGRPVERETFARPSSADAGPLATPSSTVHPAEIEPLWWTAPMAKRMSPSPASPWPSPLSPPVGRVTPVPAGNGVAAQLRQGQGGGDGSAPDDKATLARHHSSPQFVDDPVEARPSRPCWRALGTRPRPG
jgi:hypothetical protein